MGWAGSIEEKYPAGRHGPSRSYWRQGSEHHQWAHPISSNVDISQPTRTYRSLGWYKLGRYLCDKYTVCYSMTTGISRWRVCHKPNFLYMRDQNHTTAPLPIADKHHEHAYIIIWLGLEDIRSGVHFLLEMCGHQPFGTVLEPRHSHETNNKGVTQEIYHEMGSNERAYCIFIFWMMNHLAVFQISGLSIVRSVR